MSLEDLEDWGKLEEKLGEVLGLLALMRWDLEKSVASVAVLHNLHTRQLKQVEEVLDSIRVRVGD